MIRRDYLLGMIDQCVAALFRAQAAITEGNPAAAEGELDQASQGLAGLHVNEVLTKSDGELVAALLKGEPTQVLAHKCLLYSAVLSEAAELAAARGELEASHGFWERAVGLQLGVAPQDRPNRLPECVLSLAALLDKAGLDNLSIPTLATVMRYFELSGEFAKAEDALFALLESGEFNAATLRLGEQFYERLLALSDEQLLGGNLPRSEVVESMAELRARAPRET